MGARALSSLGLRAGAVGRPNVQQELNPGQLPEFDPPQKGLLLVPAWPAALCALFSASSSDTPGFLLFEALSWTGQGYPPALDLITGCPLTPGCRGVIAQVREGVLAAEDSNSSFYAQSHVALMRLREEVQG